MIFNYDAPLRLRGGAGEYNTDEDISDFSLRYKNDLSLDPLRLRGGGDDPPSTSSHHPIIKRKNPECSPEMLHLREHFADIDIAITSARAILEDMVVTGKVDRKWNDMVSHQLDEIMIAFRKVAEESARAIGQVTARRDDLRESLARYGELYHDIGVQREKIRVLEETVTTLKAQLPTYKRSINAEVTKNDEIDASAIMVISSPGSSGSCTYAAIVEAPKPATTKKKRPKMDFPPLVTPKSRITETKSSRTQKPIDARDILNSRPKRGSEIDKGLKEKARKTEPSTVSSLLVKLLGRTSENPSRKRLKHQNCIQLKAELASFSFGE